MDAQCSESSPKECAVCIEAYLPPSVPKSMPCCGHTICLKCLLRLERESDSRMLTCPECRTPSKLSRGGVEAFQTNIAIQRIVSQLQGISILEATSQIRARKNPSDVPLSAPSFMSRNKGPVRVMQLTGDQLSKKPITEKRPNKPMPTGVDGEVAKVDS